LTGLAMCGCPQQPHIAGRTSPPLRLPHCGTAFRLTPPAATIKDALAVHCMHYAFAKGSQGFRQAHSAAD